MAIAETEISDTDAARPGQPTGDAPQENGRGLLLDSLEIKNFRAFRHLVVPKLGRVNLITGKNGVGKSSLLEALYLYAEAATPDTVRQVLSDRGEVEVDPDIKENTFDREFLADVESLFHISSDTTNNTFSIGSRYNTSKLLSFVSQVSGELTAEGGDVIELTAKSNRVIVNVREKPFSYRFDSFRKQTDLTFGPGVRARITIPSTFLKTSRGSSIASGRTWDRTVIESREDDVLKMMRLIVPSIDRVSLVIFDHFDHRRTPVVKLSSRPRVVPLARLGEGLTQILAIASALATTEGGILLIDEIENGLHYSVLPDVWRLIFQTARRLNVQVFATTHSWDCIEAFQQAAAEDEESDGVLIRLLNKDGNVLSTVFDERRLAIVTRDGIEVR